MKTPSPLVFRQCKSHNHVTVDWDNDDCEQEQLQHLDFCADFLHHRIKRGPILHRFRDIADFCVHGLTPIPPQFGGVPDGPDRPNWGQPEYKP